MKLNLSYKSSKLFRPLMIIFGILGIIGGLIIAISIESLRSSVLFWILGPIILGSLMICLVIGFYLIFLNNKK